MSLPAFERSTHAFQERGVFYVAQPRTPHPDMTVQDNYFVTPPKMDTWLAAGQTLGGDPSGKIRVTFHSPATVLRFHLSPIEMNLLASRIPGTRKTLWESEARAVMWESFDMRTRVVMPLVSRTNGHLTSYEMHCEWGGHPFHIWAAGHQSLPWG